MESRRFFSEVSQSKELNQLVVFDKWLRKYCLDNTVTRISLMQARQFSPNALRGKGVIDDVAAQLSELHRLRITSEGKKKFLEVNPMLLEADNGLE
jgi:hypothetical protein